MTNREMLTFISSDVKQAFKDAEHALNQCPEKSYSAASTALFFGVSIGTGIIIPPSSENDLEMEAFRKMCIYYTVVLSKE